MRGGHGGRGVIVGRFKRFLSLGRVRTSIFHTPTRVLPFAGQLSTCIRARYLLIWLQAVGDAPRPGKKRDSEIHQFGRERAIKSRDEASQSLLDCGFAHCVDVEEMRKVVLVVAMRSNIPGFANSRSHVALALTKLRISRNITVEM